MRTKLFTPQSYDPSINDTECQLVMFGLPASRLETQLRVFGKRLAIFGAVAAVIVGLASPLQATWFPINTMADLRSKSLDDVEEEDLALLAGYYSPGDRGGGWFMWQGGSGHAHDGGRYIEPTVTHPSNGRWVRLLNGERANVKMWGATGTNANDWRYLSSPYDTDAFQRAVNACANDTNWTTELVFPVGWYALTNTIIFPAWLHLRGEACGDTIIYMQADKDVFRTTEADKLWRGVAYGSDRNLLVENLSIYGVSNGTYGAGVMLCEPRDTALIRNLVLGSGGYGIRCLGGGSPGLTVENVTAGDGYIAGLSIEGSYNGTNLSKGGAVHVTGFSGDLRRTDAEATACLVQLSNVTLTASIHDFKAEGTFGGGLICYNRSSADVYDLMGSVSIYGGTYNGGGTDLLVLKAPSGSFRTASAFIRQVNLYGGRYLIRDELTGRTVHPHTQEGTGDQQATCRQPIQYEAMIGGGIAESNVPMSRLIVGDNAIYEIDPPTNGWYRVMGQQIAHLGGRLTISTYRESSEISVDVYPGLNNASQGALINVVRQSKDSGSGERPSVTQVRAGSYIWTGPPAGSYAFVDIHVERPVTNTMPFHMRRIQLAHPIHNQIFTPSGQVQLITPTNALPYPGNAWPAGCDSTCLAACVTNSLIR